MRMQDVPNVDRPREKLIKYGPEKLSNAELIAVLLRTGTKGQNAVEVARKLLRRFKDSELTNATVEDLSKQLGLGASKATIIVAAFELSRRLLQGKQSQLIMSPKDVWEALADIRDSKKEHFVVFFLDARNQEIKREIISIGTLTESLVHPREVFEPAIRHNATQVIVAHNHPSGETEPSLDDLRVTKRLHEAGKLLGIDLVDHIIVAKKFYRII